MSKCDLRVEIDGGSRTVKPGDEIRGEVIVDVDADVRCKLVATLEWHTHGRGNKDGDERDEVVLYEGSWSAGESKRYRFTFTAPNGPFTQHGHYLNVDWLVHARADIPWAFDPKAERDLVLLPGPSSEPIDRGPSFDPDLSPGEGGCAKGCMVLFFLPFLLAGLGATAVGVAESLGYDTGGEGDLWVLFVVGPLFTLVGLIPFFIWLHGFLGRRKTGDVSVDLSRRELHLGDDFQVSLSFEPRSDFMINRIVANLVAAEVVTRGSGTNRTTYRHKAVDETLELAAETHARAFETIDLHGTLRIPESAPCSFAASDNKIEWSVEVTVDIPSWPDWSESLPLIVDP